MATPSDDKSPPQQNNLSEQPLERDANSSPRRGSDSFSNPDANSSSRPSTTDSTSNYNKGEAKKKKVEAEVSAVEAKVTDVEKAEKNDIEAKVSDVDTTPSTVVATPQEPSTAKPTSITSDRQLTNLIKCFSKPLPQRPLEAKHQFWDTQPVPKLGEGSSGSIKVGPIDSTKTVADIRKDPYQLPSPFHWVTYDVTDDSQLQEIYTLLADNYVEDDDCMFRFNYSKEFLRWALTPPGYFPEWHVGVKTDKGKLVAFVTGIPAKLLVFQETIRMAEINFLCVHKKLRTKRLAPVLIKEVTRRVNLNDLWQAVYTAGILLTKPVAQCTYYHRSLNIKKLIDVKFTGLTGKMTLSMAQKIYRLPDEPQISGLRPMERKDVASVLELLNKEFAESALIYPVFSLKEAEHVLLPRKNVIVSYLREQEGRITDFLSFYILPSSVIGHEKHLILNAGYCYYYAATTVPIIDLIKDALIIAKKYNMDVFNALDLGRNESFIKELKFGKGDGSLRYYLYNYLCPDMDPSKIGLVML